MSGSVPTMCLSCGASGASASPDHRLPPCSACGGIIVLDLGGGPAPTEPTAQTHPLTVTAMTPADFRDNRAKAWRRCWAGLDVNEKGPVLLVVEPPGDFATREAVLLGVQRVVDWRNQPGVSGEATVFALEALLQRAGVPQTPPCCVCRGTGRAVDEMGRERPCPEGCR